MRVSSDSLVSELLWDFKPLWYFGADIEFGQKNHTGRRFGFFAALHLQFAFPMQTAGEMEDRDWGPAGELTNYSRHENTTNTFFNIDFSSGVDVPTPLGSLFTFRLSAGLSYTIFSWTARDGYLRYGEEKDGSYQPLTDRDPEISVKGSVISFSQDWLYLPMGLSVFILPGRLFSGSIFFYAGPILTYLGQDEHHLKANSGQFAEYRDTIRGGYILQPGGEFRFSPSRRLSLNLRFSWRKLEAEPHGESGASATGYQGNHSFQSFGNLSGASVQMFDTGLGVILRF